MIFCISELSKINNNRIRVTSISFVTAYHSCENAGCDECTGVFGDRSGAPEKCPICGSELDNDTAVAGSGFINRVYQCSAGVGVCPNGTAYRAYSSAYHTANDSNMMAAGREDDII